MLPDSPAAPAQTLTYPPGFRERRRTNWIFLGLMYGFFYMSRYNLAAIQVATKELFGWSNTDYGSVVSAGVFVYGLAVFFNGPLADKIGGKRAILIGSAGAALFNFLFGLCILFLEKPAVVKAGVVVTPAVLNHHMKASSLLATFAALWAANHYFQSFGALSIVKINAAWFHVRERGSFAGIFGIMIQSGRFLAAYVSPLILGLSAMPLVSWRWCFWVPAAILVVMFVVNLLLVEDSPAKAGFEFHTADETREEAAQPATLGFVLRKVFASPAAWLIALSSMCIGMVRNSIDHWWAGYMSTVFSVKSADLKSFVPYVVVSFGTPVAAIAGGLVAGNASDRLFGARRAPVIFFAFLGQALTLFLLAHAVHSAWGGAVLLLAMAFFIQSAHSLVGGAASMDFGGKKAVATAAGLFDGAQYLAATFVGYGMGRLLDAFKNAKTPGVEYDVWPLAPIPFALIGALVISRLWYVVPGRPREALSEARLRGRTALLKNVFAVERVAMGGWALVAGAIGVLTLILPQVVARELYSHTLSPGAVVWSQMFGGTRVGLAIIALAAAFTPRPPRALVRALLIGLLATVIGPLFSAITSGVSWAEVQPLRLLLYLDGAVALVLLATSVVRANLAPVE
jgi:OPA family glycerol-3-phosphate transporter-like MFS transporter